MIPFSYSMTRFTVLNDQWKSEAPWQHESCSCIIMHLTKARERLPDPTELN